MNFFTSIVEKAKKVPSLGQIAVKLLDTNQALFSSPITTLTKGVKAGVAESQAKTGKQNAIDVTKTWAITSAAVLTAGTGVGRSIVKAVTPKSLLGKGAAALAIPAAVTYVTQKPKEVLKLPGQALSVSIDAGNLAANPTVQGAKEFVQEHPVGTAAAAGALVIGAGKAVLPLAGGYLGREATEEQTQAIEKQTEVIKQGYNDAAPQVVYQQMPPQIIQFQPLPSEIPQMQTQSPAVAAPMATLAAPAVTKKKKKKAKKKAKKKKKTRRSKRKKTKKKAKKKAKKKKKTIKRRKK